LIVYIYGLLITSCNPSPLSVYFVKLIVCIYSLAVDISLLRVFQQFVEEMLVFSFVRLSL